MYVNYRRRLFYLVLTAIVFKLIVAGLLELGNDEVYYYTYALQPDWNHFDHPPMVGLLIRLTSFNLLWVNDISMRLGAILGCAISTYFIFWTGKIAISERAGWYTALIYNCSIYTGIIAGFFILPDSPQMPFWTASLYLMSRIIFKGENKRSIIWILLGLMIGLASFSKVHGLYLWVGFGLFMLLKRVKWLLNWRLYLGILFSLLCVLPIVFWNINNKFITYQFHSGRIIPHQIEWSSLLRELLGEVAYQNPIVFILVITSISYFIKRRALFSSLHNVWFLCMSLPMILSFWGLALFNPILPHWSGPAYISLFFLGAGYIELKPEAKAFRFIKFAALLFVGVISIATISIKWLPVNWGSSEINNYGEYSPALDLSGWCDFSKSFSKIVAEDIKSGKMDKRSPLIISKWFPGGHLEFYTARKANLQVIGIGNIENLHKFAWLNRKAESLHLGEDAYCIVPSNFPEDPSVEYKDYFTEIQSPVVFEQKKGNLTVRYFYVYRMKNCKSIPDPLLK